MYPLKRFHIYCAAFVYFALPLAARSVDVNSVRPDEPTPKLQVTWSKQIVPEYSIQGLAFSSDGTRLCAGWPDHVARVWDLRQDKRPIQFSSRRTEGTPALDEACGAEVAFSPDALRVVTGSTVVWNHDRVIRPNFDAHVWDLRTGREILTLVGHEDAIRSVAYSRDGRFIATGSKDRTARLWDARDGRELMKLAEHQQEVASVAISPDGRCIASGSMGVNGVRVWDVKTGAHKGSKPVPEFALCGSVAFSAQGEYLAAWDSSPAVRVWRMDTGEQVAWLRNVPTYAGRVAFCPDRQQVAVLGAWGRPGAATAQEAFESRLRVFQWATGEIVHSTPPIKGIAMALAVSPAGSSFATGSGRVVQIWEPPPYPAKEATNSSTDVKAGQ